MRLTALQIEQLPIPAKGQKTYWEHGFGIRVSQGGSKSFVVMYGTDRRLKTLGKYPSMSLKNARDAASLVKVTDTPKRRLDRLSEARSAFLDDCETRLRPKTIEQYTHYLNQCDKTYLSDITKTSIIDQTAHAIASWKAFFNWCIRHELVSRNPFTFYVARYGSRFRVLSADETKAIWSYDYPPYSDYLKLQLLTGQRRGQWGEYSIVGDTIVFPATAMKAKKEHSIPLTEWAASLLPLPYFNGWSKAKARIDKHVPLDAWRLHDIRRTFSTNCASLDIPLHVTERIMAHTSGTVSGVAATYNRYNYLKEMRQALDIYEKHIQSLIT